jgi:ribosomal protein S18 acetylase RimI-like enzyme
MIRLFSLDDLDSILQIESQSFPKSPYDWTTFLNLHYLYPETFLVYVSPSSPRPEASCSLGVDPERALHRRREGQDSDAAQRADTNHGREEEKILGYIIFSRDGHIISIAVHPQHRKKGIGTQLLQRALKTFHPKKVWAEVRRSNQGAQTFYLKMGFQITGMVPNYYGNEDALIVEWAHPLLEE